MANQLILASSSPRREELLKQVNLPYKIRIPDVDEEQIQTYNPVEKVKQLATIKAENVPLKSNDEVILAADTVVSYQQNIFEKPKNQYEAQETIKALSGNYHEVFTGVMIRSPMDKVVFVERTKVEFWSLTQKEIAAYIKMDDPYDKAGAYGIQSIGAAFVKQVIGDYFNIVGLPISRVIQELKRFNIHPNW